MAAAVVVQGRVIAMGQTICFDVEIVTAFDRSQWVEGAVEQFPPGTTKALLDGRIAAILAGNLGGFPRLLALPGHIAPPAVVGAAAGVAYLLLFCAPLLLFPTPVALLVKLSLWGGLYAVWAVSTARLTSAIVQEICTTQVIENLSADRAAAIDGELVRKFSAARIATFSVAIAVPATLVSVWTLCGPTGAALPQVPHLHGQVAIWAAGFFILYLTAARATDTARFYGVFARHLAPDDLHRLDPAADPLIRSLSGLGRTVLVFWIGIALSVVTLVMFRAEAGLFVLAVTGVAGFFSLPFGSLVLIASEARLRRLVWEAKDHSIRQLQAEIDRMFDRRGQLRDREWARLQHLLSLHLKMAASDYRGFLAILAGASPILLGPAVTILSNLDKILKVFRP
jgi:hypothetical protein